MTDDDEEEVDNDDNLLVVVVCVVSVVEIVCITLPLAKNSATPKLTKFVTHRDDIIPPSWGGNRDHIRTSLKILSTQKQRNP